ncbi:F0F1 ATP synthase subunit gamma [Bacteroides sp. 224]|uniref:F0F1 ATP synthase subunit gamma n=1 Tax=Bacteroides sp. 224 TaxID=2302936 RepID=UPI0013D8B242|nr:F0F1 ATP synthase subunit gamma [Bacteroides sp. 224]NDV65151.1 F0F1 ATP synthase subunit gamma [Bacteroides sp. 224]
MASLKEVKGRINSVKSTLKITSAMKMVASAKLHKAQAAIENMLPYQEKMNHILTNFLSVMDNSFYSPYMEERQVKRVAIVVFSSNSSLCGAFNANVIKKFVQVADSYKELGIDNIWVYPVGRKIEDAIKKIGYTPKGSYLEMADKPTYEEAYQLAGELMNLFLAGEVDKVEVIYHHFKSSGSQLLLNKQFLPLDIAKLQEEISNSQELVESDTSPNHYKTDYIVEPSEAEFVESLLPEVLKLKIFTALLDSSASEHAARMMAMQIATDNANELIQDLTKQYNRSRQQAITNELQDIVGGSMT